VRKIPGHGTAEPGRTCRSVAQELGVHPQLIVKWRAAVRSQGDDAFAIGRPRETQVTAAPSEAEWPASDSRLESVRQAASPVRANVRLQAYLGRGEEGYRRSRASRRPGWNSGEPGGCNGTRVGARHLPTSPMKRMCGSHRLRGKAASRVVEADESEVADRGKQNNHARDPRPFPPRPTRCSHRWC